MNKDLFLNVYKDKFLNININNEIRNIHNKIHYKNFTRYNWERLIKSPTVLSQYGYLHLIKLIDISNNKEVFKYCCEIAARFDHLDVLKYVTKINIKNKRLFWDGYEGLLQSALISGNLEIIEYVYSLVGSKCKVTRLFISYAAESGSIEVCGWFINLFKDLLFGSVPSNLLFESAARYGHLNVVKWGLGLFGKYKSQANGNTIWANAIKSKNIALLDFMYSHEQFKNLFNFNGCLLEGIMFSNIKVTEWLLSKDDGKLNHKIVFLALMRKGTVEMIEYFSDKLGYKIGQPYKNKAEWFYKMCNSHLGINKNNYSFGKIKHQIIIWWYENITNCKLSYNPLDHCCLHSLDLIRWFTENNRPEKIPPHILNKFSEDISLDYFDTDLRKLSIIDYITRYRTEQFRNIIEIMDLVLFYSESMELVNLISKKYKRVKCSDYILKKAISNNKLESVKWIHNNTTFRCTNEEIRSAYFLKDSAMIEWLHQNRTESCDPLNIKKRFQHCSTAVKSFIIHNKPEMIPTDVLEYVHDFSDFKFIIDNHPTYIRKTKSMIDVCASGNVENVKYLHEYNKKHGINGKTNNFSMSSFKKSLELAIKNGFIDIVIYLFENGPDITKPPGIKNQIDLGNEPPMYLACKYGRLNICKYLQEHTPFRLEPKYFNTAVENGNLELVQWIYENHQYHCSNYALESAGKNHLFKVVRYLLDTQQYKITEDMFRNAIKSSNLEFVKFCIEYGYEYRFNIIEFATKCGSDDIVLYLLETRYKYEQTKKRKINETKMTRKEMLI